MSVTLDDIMIQCRDRSNMPSDDFISNTELIRLINRSYQTLYDLCLDSMGAEAFLDGYEFSTVAGQTEYSVPDNFYKFVGLDLQYSSVWHTLTKYNHADRNKYRNATEFIVDGKPRIRYNVKKSTIDLLPTPESAHSCWLGYVPQLTALSNTSDLIDAGIPDSFTEFIVTDVAARMLIKEESDPSALLQEKQMIITKISATGSREFDVPEATQDSENTLFNLRIQARYKADMLTDKLVTDTELDHYINQSYGNLQDMLVRAYGNNYFLDGYEFSTTSGQKDYDLPTDFYKLGGVDMTSSGTTYQIPKYNFQERNWYENDSIHTKLGAPYFHYQIMQNSIRFLPEPEETINVTIWYTKRLSTLNNDSDSMSSIIIKDWSEYLLLDVAIKMLTKKIINANQTQIGQLQVVIQSLNTQFLKQQQRLIEMIQIRDWGQPETVVDAEGLDRTNIWGRW